jgi:hypothetical protein
MTVGRHARKGNGRDEERVRFMLEWERRSSHMGSRDAKNGHDKFASANGSPGSPFLTTSTSPISAPRRPSPPNPRRASPPNHAGLLRAQRPPLRIRWTTRTQAATSARADGEGAART